MKEETEGEEGIYEGRDGEEERRGRRGRKEYVKDGTEGEEERARRKDGRKT